MADASYLQTSFLGGEWSPFSQGRMDRADYRSALSVCVNAMAVEEGGWTRRPGLRYVAYTRRGQPAVLREFQFVQSQPYVLEFSAGHLRFFTETGLLTENTGLSVITISSADPASVLVGSAHGFTTGDAVLFSQLSAEPAPGAGHLLNRVFVVTVVDTLNFTLTDQVSGVNFDGSLLGTLPKSGLHVERVLDIVTPYTTAQLTAIKTIQTDKDVVILEPTIQPYRLLATSQPEGDGCVTADFDFSALVFQDGPYLDAPTTGTVITPSGLSGSITVTLSDTAAMPFLATDVGRLLRLFSEPLPWSATTAYDVNDPVGFGGLYYVRLVAGTTPTTPDLDLDNWIISTTSAQWAWGTITAVSSDLIATLALDPVTPLLYTTAVATWTAGLYSDTTGWPSVGVYNEGRLWLANDYIPNRLDASMSNDPFVFSPTGPDGTVADNNGISAVFNATEVNPILWMSVDDQGILCGTQGKEWLVRSTSVGDTMTPTNIQARPVSAYGSEDTPPIRIGQATLFVSRFNRKVYELMGDPNSTVAKYSATNLALTSKHITADGIAALAYQREIVPKLWVQLADSTLAGVTYKRDGQYGAEGGSFAAWHRNILGHGRNVGSIVTGPTHYGLDTLWAVTYDPVTNEAWVERLTDMFGQNASPTTAFFVDGGRVPVASEIIGGTVMRYYGFDDLEGKTLSVWAAGLDVGDLTVTNGVVDVPLTGVLNSVSLAAATATLGGDTYQLGVQTDSGAATHTVGTPNLGGLLWMTDGTTTLGTQRAAISPNWDQGYAFVYTFGHGSGAGIRKFDLNTGLKLTEASALAIFGVDDDPHSINIGAMDLNGNLYFKIDSDNSGMVAKINAGLELVSTWGTGSSSFGSNASHLSAPQQMVATTVNGRTFVASASALGNIIGSGEIAIFDGDNMAWVQNVNPTQGSSLMTDTFKTFDGCDDTGTIYVLGTAQRTPAADPNSSPIGLYKLSITVDPTGAPEIGFGLIRSYNPADIDPTWTEWGAGGGAGTMAMDQSDGNVLCVLFDASGHSYTLKLAAADGSIMWKNSTVAVDFSNSRVVGSTHVWVAPTGSGSHRTAYTLDTVAGNFTTATVIGLTSAANAWDGLTTRLLGFGDFNQATGSPALDGGTPTSFTSDWYQYRVGTQGAFDYNNYNAPAVIGWNYISQGQLLRPVSPPEVGAQNGPALGKTRRSHMYSMLVHRAGPVFVGSDFNAMRPVEFLNANQTLYAEGVLYDGVVWGTLEDDYSFNSMFAWEIRRPNPATVLAIEGFIHTQDR